MSAITSHAPVAIASSGQGVWARLLRSPRFVIGGSLLLVVVLASVLTMPMTLSKDSGLYYNNQSEKPELANRPPLSTGRAMDLFGTDELGRSIFVRCLLGGTISLAIGIGAAVIAVSIGVTVGMVSGYVGGVVDSVLMRIVDVLYGLPYVLLIILLKVGLEPAIRRWMGSGQPGEWLSESSVNLLVMFLAIGLVSWLTMARVIRGQVLSLRSQPFIEACRAAGLPRRRIFTRHLLPNLLGPITVYATLTVPSAILQESFLSFLGIGVSPPLPSWGGLANTGLQQALNPIIPRWWTLAFPCGLLAITLLCLNFVGDGLRDVFDPKSDQAKL